MGKKKFVIYEEPGKSLIIPDIDTTGKYIMFAEGK
jgi:hypothetical protein